MPIGSCGNYGVFAPGSDSYFYNEYTGKLVGRVRREASTITACESFDPSFVPPTEECRWVPHCRDVDLSKARHCPSEVGRAIDAGHHPDGSTHLDAGDPRDATTSLDASHAADARSTRDANSRD
jgi:hypothetical protein